METSTHDLIQQHILMQMEEEVTRHFIKAITLHLSTKRSTSLFLWRKKLCTKCALIFLKFNNWSTLEPACKAESLISRPMFFSYTVDMSIKNEKEECAAGFLNYIDPLRNEP